MKLKLRSLRLQHGLKQENIAELLETSQAVYSRYETGEREPNLDTLCKIADFYKVPLDILIGRIPPETKLDHIIKKLTPDQKEKAAEIIKTAFDIKKEDA